MPEMPQSWASWLDECARLPGLLTCGILFPDHTYVSQTPAVSMAPDSWDQAWQTLSETLNGLHLHRVTATRLCWTYEKGRVYFAIGSAGTCLGLCTSVGPESIDPEIIEALLNQFLQINHENGSARET